MKRENKLKNFWEKLNRTTGKSCCVPEQAEVKAKSVTTTKDDQQAKISNDEAAGSAVVDK